MLCHATVAQLIARGAEAVCPARSRVGEGTAAGIAHGARVQYHLGVYAFPGKLSFAAEQNGMSLRQGFFGTIAGQRITLDTPTSSGAIDPTLFSATIAARSHSGHAFIRTPEQCPNSGHWTIRSSFQALSAAAGGHSIGPRQTVTTQSPCRSK